METRILTDLLDPAVAVLPHEHLLAYWRDRRHACGLNSLHTDGLLHWRTGIPDAFFNGVLAERPARADESAAIDAMIAYFRAERIQAFNWWLSSGHENAGWDVPLSAHGFALQPGTPGMVIDLSHLPELRIPQGARIVRVTSAAENRVFNETVCKGFGIPDEYVPIMQRLIDHFGYDGPSYNYIGYWDCQPVAASSLFLALGAAGIYEVATLEDFRGRGLGTALTLFALQDARKMGYRIGVLQASPMGQSVYEKIGFKTTCTVKYYTLELAEGTKSAHP